MCAVLMTWKIQYCRSLFVCYYCPTFFAENLESTKWKLYLLNNKVCLSRELDDCPGRIKVQGKLLCIRQDGREISHLFTKEFEKQGIYEVCNFLRTTKTFEAFTVQCYLSQSSEFSPFVEYVAHTEDYPVEKYSIVRNVLLPVFVDQEVQSNPIYLYASSKYFSGFEILLKSNSEGIYVTVKLKDLKETVFVNHKIKLMNSEERLLTAFEDTYSYGTKVSEISFLFNRKVETFDTLTPNIKIIACFDVRSYTHTSHIVSTNYPLITCHTSPENTLGNDVPSLNKVMKAMHVDKKFCDFTIRCHGREFQVHKVVLAAASPVFGAMLDMDLAEKQSSAVDIEDIEPDTVSQLIDFLYTDTLNEVEWDSCINLYFAANKYQIQDLIQNCARFMKNHLTVENVCEVLSISDMHQDADLMKASKEFVRSHFKQVLPSKQWQSFMKTNTEAACLMMYEICTLNEPFCC